MWYRKTNVSPHQILIVCPSALPPRVWEKKESIDFPNMGWWSRGPPPIRPTFDEFCFRWTSTRPRVCSGTPGCVSKSCGFYRCTNYQAKVFQPRIHNWYPKYILNEQFSKTHFQWIASNTSKDITKYISEVFISGIHFQWVPQNVNSNTLKKVSVLSVALITETNNKRNTHDRFPNSEFRVFERYCIFTRIFLGSFGLDFRNGVLEQTKVINSIQPYIFKYPGSCYWWVNIFLLC